jgi:hypothetical protein
MKFTLGTKVQAKLLVATSNEDLPKINYLLLSLNFISD